MTLPGKSNVPSLEETLRQSEQRFATFMNHLSGYAWMKDLEGRYVFTNHLLAQLEPYRAGWLGKTDADLWPAEIAATFRSNDETVIATRKPLQMVEPYFRNGEARHSLVTKFPIFDSTGAVEMVGGASIDITERLKAERADAELAAIVNSSDDAIISKTLNGVIVSWNAAAERIYGYSASEAIGRPITILTRPEQAAEIDRILESIKRGEPVKHFETTRLRKDGRQISVSLTVSPTRNSKGEIAGASTIARDITEQKCVEEALAERALRYKTLLETSGDSIYVLNQTGDLLEANGTFLRRRGYSESEAKNLNVADWDAQWTRKQLQESLLTLVDKSVVFETRHRCKDNSSVFDVEVCATGVRIAGQPMFFCVARDVTERKELERQVALRERRLNSFFAGATAGLCILDEKLRYAQINDTLAGMNGLPAKEHLGRTIQEVLPSFSPVITPLLERVLATGEPILDIELNGETPRKPGVTGYWMESLFPIVGRHGQPEAVGVIAVEVTASKKAKEALNTANHQLRFLSRRLFKVQEEERRHLARELHDEIGQALTAAKLNLQSVIANGDRATVARLQETTAILDRLLGQVRQISLDLRPSMLDDLGLVPALRSLLHEQGRRASVAVSFSAENMPENLDPEVQTTCFRIAQEGITNAVRHANATQIDVDLRCENEKLRLFIRDDGIGFDVELVRGQAAELGLIGMRERAALVGGQAKIISSPNKGTTLEVFLPLISRPDGQGRHSKE